MTAPPTEQVWRHKVALATITGLISGITRAAVTWLLEYLTRGS